MNNIIKRIKACYPVSDESLEALTKHFVRHTFPTKTIIIHADRFDPNFYLIEKGITRSFILHEGKEITTWFSVEGDGAYGSCDLYHSEAGFENVETLEETEAYSIPIETLNNLYETHIDIANWMRVFQQEIFLHLQERHISRLVFSAQERYDKLLKEFPDVFNRVNLGYIASYLGITQPSLSRIRANL